MTRFGAAIPRGKLTRDFPRGETTANLEANELFLGRGRRSAFPLKATLEIRRPLHVQVAIARLHTSTAQVLIAPIKSTRVRSRYMERVAKLAIEPLDLAASRSASRRRSVRDQRFLEADNMPLFRESMEGTAG